MSEWWMIPLAFLGGILLGGIYFGGLWLTIQQLPKVNSPALLTFSSFFGRTVVALAGFYLISGGHWERILAALVGFILARQVMIRQFRPGGKS